MLHARILVRIQEGARHRKTARATIQPAISLMPPHRSYVRRLSRRANWLLTSAVVLKCIVLVVYLTGVGRRSKYTLSWDWGKRRIARLMMCVGGKPLTDWLMV